MITVLVGTNVQSDMDRITNELTGLQRSVIPDATIAAMNKTARKVASVVIKDVAGRSKLPQKAIRMRTRVVRASKWQYADPHGITAAVDVLDWDLRIWKAATPSQKATAINTYGKSRKAGLKFGQHRFPGGFMGRPRKGGGRGKRLQHQDIIRPFEQKGTTRLPIRQLVVPLVGVRAAMVDSVNVVAARDLPKILRHEVDWRLRKKGLR